MGRESTRRQPRNVVWKGMKRTLIGLGCVAASLVLWSATGCRSKEPSCDAVFEHMKAIAPDGMADVFEGSRSQTIEKCERLSADQKKCLMATQNLNEVAA